MSPSRLVWDARSGYCRYKCSCLTSVGTACRRWAIGVRDGVTFVCQSHLVSRPVVSRLKFLLRKTASDARIVECPVCLDDCLMDRRAPCGHCVCSDCCLQMGASGRSLCCPLCRDTRFKVLVECAVLSL